MSSPVKELEPKYPPVPGLFHCRSLHLLATLSVSSRLVVAKEGDTVMETSGAPWTWQGFKPHHLGHLMSFQDSFNCRVSQLLCFLFCHRHVPWLVFICNSTSSSGTRSFNKSDLFLLQAVPMGRSKDLEDPTWFPEAPTKDRLRKRMHPSSPAPQAGVARRLLSSGSREHILAL
jgi:hypothetical protein